MTDEQIEKEIIAAYYNRAGLSDPGQANEIKVYVHRGTDIPHEPVIIDSTIVLSDGSMCFVGSRLPAMQLAYDAYLWEKKAT